jgi:hypothetical protein
MHSIEPFYNWRNLYCSENDKNSPFYNRAYSEYELSNTIYNYYIHSQWDTIDSPTLYIKVLFADYSLHYVIIELIGEWNDCLHNDIMFLKRNVIDEFIFHGINKFILVGENVLNFHSSDDCYYEEWFNELDDGWIAFVNFRQHVLQEFSAANIDYYIVNGELLNNIPWRTFLPLEFYRRVNDCVVKRLGF